MRYAMLITTDESVKYAPAEVEAGMAEVYAWFEKWSAAGKIADGGAELQGTSTAKTVRGSTITDGPFVEAKEVIGGIVLLNAESLDEAVEIAGTWPGLSYESVAVEVRPTVEHNM